MKTPDEQKAVSKIPKNRAPRCPAFGVYAEKIKVGATLHVQNFSQRVFTHSDLFPAVSGVDISGRNQAAVCKKVPFNVLLKGLRNEV